MSARGVPLKNQVVIWECEWDRLKNYPLEDVPQHLVAQAKKVRLFMTEVYKDRPLSRLAPREAMRGGKVEAFGFGWEAKNNPNERMLAIDYISL